MMWDDGERRPESNVTGLWRGLSAMRKVLLPHFSGFPWWLSSEDLSGDGGSIPGKADSLENEMATHSSILAWTIPWTEEPSGLHSMGSQRIRYD